MQYYFESFYVCLIIHVENSFRSNEVCIKTSHIIVECIYMFSEWSISMLSVRHNLLSSRGSIYELFLKFPILIGIIVMIVRKTAIPNELQTHDMTLL